MPTIIEAGVAGYETYNWWGTAVARGTPPAIVQRLNTEIGAVLKSPEMEKRLRGEAAEPVIKSPDELGKYVAAEMAKWQNSRNSRASRASNAATSRLSGRCFLPARPTSPVRS